MRCIHCGCEMVESTTTFTLVRNRIVYVTENAPCLECPICGHISFSQEVSKRLEKYCSGHVAANDFYKSLVFRWNAPMVEIMPSSTKTDVIARLTSSKTESFPLVPVV